MIFEKIPRRLRQDVATHNCAHFIGKRKQKRKTPRQKRKQKRKPGIAHVGHTCFHIDFVLFLYIFVSSGLAIQSQPQSLQQLQTQPLQQSRLQCGVQNRGKAPPPKDYQKRKQNVSTKEQKLPRVRGEHFLGLWIHLAAASSQKQQAAAGAAAAAAAGSKQKLCK